LALHPYLNAKAVYAAAAGAAGAAKAADGKAAVAVRDALISNGWLDL
jgi:hypothetical protein